MEDSPNFIKIFIKTKRDLKYFSLFCLHIRHIKREANGVAETNATSKRPPNAFASKLFFCILLFRYSRISSPFFLPL